ncbi:MAG TPA: glycerol kinase GlpK [Acidimicrobiia bacterium]|nr:glycerol kinase GlpK [Acidimicrobiia bacterium]
MPPARFVGAIDQGTTSTRFVIFDHSGSIVAADQAEHVQHYPHPGWVEHDPQELWEMTIQVAEGALSTAGLRPADLAAVGITNQRETTVVWDRATGEPVARAIVWQDTRTAGIVKELAGDRGVDRYRSQTGLPLSTYFAGPKIRWLLDHHGLEGRAQAGELAAGTIDSWLLWKLTGGRHHVTDVTNASRTLLMDLGTLGWDPALCDAIGVPGTMLAEIRSSSEIYAEATEILSGVPLAGVLGDQQAALFGQTCFEPGQAKNTYGTGNFMLLNTGNAPTTSQSGLLTTVAYKLGHAPAVYALEGSIAVTGSLVHWLRDNLGIIGTSADVETLAAGVPDSGDVYFVPAFSGLFAPRWRPDARGAIVGLTRFATSGHVARAALEATAFQTREVLDAMVSDSGVHLTELRVDGGMVGNELLMQFQADILDVAVVRPTVSETTALGAAYAAGLAVGFWEDLAELRRNWTEDRRWSPQMDSETRASRYARWNQAVTRTLDWV